MHPAIHARETPLRLACTDADSAQSLTYGQLNDMANQGAQFLRHRGLKRGDVVATLLDNSFEVFALAWAAQRSGLYLTSISTKFSAADIAYVLQDSGARILLASDRLQTVAELALESRPAVHGFLCSSVSERMQNWRKACGLESIAPISDQSAGTDMLYSSGTTGRPKGVRPPLPTGPVDEQTALMRMRASLYGMRSDSIYLSTAPLYHAAPLRWAMTLQRFGATVLFTQQFDPEKTLALIEQYRVTHATFVPTHFIRMLKLTPEIRARYELSSLEAVVHAAAPCPVPVKQAMIDWWGPIVHEYYSGTETCGITAISAPEWLRKPGSVGRAVLGTVKITDDNEDELPPGKIGNVYFADGPDFEYHNDPKKTAQAFNRHGWATLGDIGRLDEDGYLYLTDRKNFMIISGGVNIYPQEIESCIITHPK